MVIPFIGERYRGIDGHIGFLLRQAAGTLRAGLDSSLRSRGLTAGQYGVLSVIAADAGSSAADLARAYNTTPQAMNGVLATLEREELIERTPHPRHGRIVQVRLTGEGRRRLRSANPVVRALEKELERGFTDAEIATVKRWLVESGIRLEQIARSGAVGRGIGK